MRAVVIGSKLYLTFLKRNTHKVLENAAQGRTDQSLQEPISHIVLVARQDVRF
jgi:hypothetical protein